MFLLPIWVLTWNVSHLLVPQTKLWSWGTRRQLTFQANLSTIRHLNALVLFFGLGSGWLNNLLSWNKWVNRETLLAWCETTNNFARVWQRSNIIDTLWNNFGTWTTGILWTTIYINFSHINLHLYAYKYFTHSRIPCTDELTHKVVVWV